MKSSQDDDSEGGGGVADGGSLDSLAPPNANAHANAPVDCEVPVKSISRAAGEADRPQPSSSYKRALLAELRRGEWLMWNDGLLMFEIEIRERIER